MSSPPKAPQKMSQRQITATTLTSRGWRRMVFGGPGIDDARYETWFKWEHSIRRELHLIYQTSGQLEAWSEWRNERVSVDQDEGRRARLIELICEEEL